MSIPSTSIMSAPFPPSASDTGTEGDHEMEDTNSELGGASPALTSRRVRSAEEDARLRRAVAKLGSSRGPGSAWGAISQCVGGKRTNKVGEPPHAPHLHAAFFPDWAFDCRSLDDC